MMLRLLFLSLFLALACGDDDGGSDASADASRDGALADSGSDSSTDTGGRDATGMDAARDAPSFVDSAIPDTALPDGAMDTPQGRLCTAENQRNMRCGEVGRPFENCIESATCLVTLIRDDVLEPMVSCARDLACGMPDDVCFTAAGLSLTPSSAATAYEARCLSTRSGCDSFSDDLCFVDIVDDTTIGELDACLDEACDDIAGCLFRVVTCG